MAGCRFGKLSGKQARSFLPRLRFLYSGACFAALQVSPAPRLQPNQIGSMDAQWLVSFGGGGHRLAMTTYKSEAGCCLCLSVLEFAMSITPAAAFAEPLSDLYSRLKRIAGRQLGQTPSPATLSATVLVHEAYLRFAVAGRLDVRDDSHLLSLWTRTMRHVLIDYCRARATAKRSGHKLDIDELDCAERADPDALLALEQALRALDAHDPRLAQVIELRVFAGLDSAGVAAQLGVDVRTVQRDWVRARAWLQDAVDPR